MLLHLETQATQRELGSKIQSKFRTISPPNVISGKLGEMTELILAVWPKTIPLEYFRRGD